MTTTERSPGLINDHAHLADVPAIHRLIQYWADETGDVLPRSEGEIYGTLRDFMVLRDVQDGREQIVAAGALHIEWKDLAEVKSLVVDPKQQGRGLGRVVVEALLDEAGRLGLRTVFALTTTPAFFERVGFQQAAVSSFPRKVWNECFRCPKYSNCDEVAVSIDLRDKGLRDGLLRDGPSA
ncbi:MAG: amino-acid N-acetyltransferase [Chloroflexi bacterium]|jgi:amino-acid N-acetyltransferase|nr:MAG: amino-acid N-acetyltransferase [Chloroflexota bacterium]